MIDRFCNVTIVQVRRGSHERGTPRGTWGEKRKRRVLASITVGVRDRARANPHSPLLFSTVTLRVHSALRSRLLYVSVRFICVRIKLRTAKVKVNGGIRRAARTGQSAPHGSALFGTDYTSWLISDRFQNARPSQLPRKDTCDAHSCVADRSSSRVLCASRASTMATWCLAIRCLPDRFLRRVRGHGFYAPGTPAPSDPNIGRR